MCRLRRARAERGRLAGGAQAALPRRRAHRLLRGVPQRAQDQGHTHGDEVGHPGSRGGVPVPDRRVAIHHRRRGGRGAVCGSVEMCGGVEVSPLSGVDGSKSAGPAFFRRESFKQQPARHAALLPSAFLLPQLDLLDCFRQQPVHVAASPPFPPPCDRIR
eukprot:355106-Chlamydomonas_euryale.AAC.5